MLGFFLLFVSASRGLYNTWSGFTVSMWQQWFVASEPQGHETCSGTSRPVKSLDMSRDISLKRSLLQGSLSTRNENVQPLRSACETEADSDLIIIFTLKHVTCFYMQSVSFLLCCSNDEMNIIQRWFLKHFCSTALTCTSIWICKWLISYNEKKSLYFCYGSEFWGGGK